jgi:glycolate oxidase|tara:strand:+ start:10154 stop:11656 length:1503 start_codon:yes stop_codon:yes gene_type:complete
MNNDRSELQLSSADRRRFNAALRKLLPRASIIDDDDRLVVYESDALTARREIPWIVVLPDSIAQVREIMKLASKFRVPVVARGAGTGLSGGAMPTSTGILLSLAKFNSILAIDQDNRTARVEPGVTNLAVSEYVKPLGLYYAPDPSSQIACTIGGNIAENAGGVHCLKYGLTVHNVLQLKVVTPEGELITIGSTALDSPGYDLLAAMIGSEGMLGIVVEATVKLMPMPQTAKLVMAAFKSIARAGDAVAAIISRGIIPAGLEMMDRMATKAVEEFVEVGYPLDAAAVLLCEVDGAVAEVEDHMATLTELLQREGAYRVRVAQDERERQELWRGRKSAFPAVGRISPDYLCMDGTIPRHKLGEVLEEISDLAGSYRLQVANVFHAGDGNLHPLILYDANNPDELRRAELLGAEILELCVARGGTITGEHGVGIEKIDQMCVQFSEAEISQFHELKASFDPQGILNPGKAVPTLSRCREFSPLAPRDGVRRDPVNSRGSADS